MATLAGGRRPTTIKWCTYNIMHHGAGRLQLALKAMGVMGYDFGFFTETKIGSDNYAQSVGDYKVFGSQASNHQGGVALFWKENNDRYMIESVRGHGPNIVSCILVTGEQRWKAVGMYCPPSEDDGATLHHLQEALASSGSMPIILGGDLNVDLLASGRSARDTEIATVLASYGLDDMSRHFLQRTKHRRRWTWKQRREGRVVRSRCDVIMGTDRRHFTGMRILDPPGYDSDHFLLAAELVSAAPAEQKAYLRGRKAIPLTNDPTLDTRAADAKMVELLQFKGQEETPDQTSRPDWISDSTWALMSQRVSLFKTGRLSEAKRKELKRRIRSGLRLDRKRRAEKAGTEIDEFLSAGDIAAAFGVAKRWYRKVTGRPPPPAREDMEETANTYEQLYTATLPPGDPIPLPPETTSPVRDEAPTEEEIIEAIARLKNGKAPGVSGIRAEDLKRWAEEHKVNESPPLRIVVDIVQTAYSTGQIPQALNVAILVLLKKPCGNEYRGIGLLETIWKLISSIMDRRMKEAVEFDDSVHGFRQQRGTGTAILRNKLSMQTAFAKHVTLKQLYLDMKKAYDTLDRSRTLLILEGYGVGPNTLRIIRTFWERHTVIPRASGYHGRAFRATRGVTQGDILSPMIFNVVVDCIIKAWRREHPAVAAVVDTIFYADDGELISEDPVALQAATVSFTDYCNRVGLKMNSAKTKVLITAPGPLNLGLSSPAYRLRMSGVGVTERARRAMRVDCTVCGQEFRATSLQRHMVTAHQVFQVQRPPLSRRLFEGTGTGTCFTIDVPRSNPPTRTMCPVPNCVGHSTRPDDMRTHFMWRHPMDSVVIETEGLLPKCPKCGKQVKQGTLANHGKTQLCQRGQVARAKRETERQIHAAQALSFTIQGEEVERVDQFRHLGRPILANDQDTGAIQYNLKRAQAKWQTLARVLAVEGVKPKVTGMFYKAVVQSVLLYGSETWVLTRANYDILNSFHMAVARKISKSQARWNPETEEWDRTAAAIALERAGLFPLITYLVKRREYILPYAMTIPDYQNLQERNVIGETARKIFWTDDPDLQKLANKISETNED